MSSRVRVQIWAESNVRSPHVVRFHHPLPPPLGGNSRFPGPGALRDGPHATRPRARAPRPTAPAAAVHYGEEGGCTLARHERPSGHCLSIVLAELSAEPPQTVLTLDEVEVDEALTTTAPRMQPTPVHGRYREPTDRVNSTRQ